MKDRIDTIIKNMSIEDKIAFCSGKDFWHTKDHKNLDIPSMMMCDGPHGLRKQIDASDMLGLNHSIKATCFPTASLSACSFNENLLEEMGEALGKECILHDVKMLLGPGANIKRNPLCGRNFEYFSEDPVLSGKMAASLIRGIEKTGTASTLKHFALNNQEFKRFSSNSMVDEKTMREIYLKSFEIAIKEGHPSSVMCSYNKINGVHSSDDSYVLNSILRNDFGFDGMVVTDWGAMNDRIKGFQAGCDLNMPGGSAYQEKECLEAYHKGILKKEDIDASVRNILQVVFKKQQSYNVISLDEHYELARKVAEESIVLLKNENQILPIEEKDNVVFIGSFVRNMRYQGSGSSHINPYKMSDPASCLKDIDYRQGCDDTGNCSDKDYIEIQEAAKNADKVVIFAGLTEVYESEGFDRKHMQIPKGHLRMIEAACKVNNNVIVVLLSGSAIEIPFASDVKGIVYAGLGGEASLEAICNVLVGKVNPSGKLAETWPLHYDDCISSTYYGVQHPMYKEGIYVGYRYYDKANVKVRYPFGYGLSYTTFKYSDLHVEKKQDKVYVSCLVNNTGSKTGKEVVQVYISNQTDLVYTPVKELKAFKKIELQVNETKEVNFVLDDDSFKVFEKEWMIQEGNYDICIVSNGNVVLQETICMEGKRSVITYPSWYRNPVGVASDEEFKQLYGRPIEIEKIEKGKFTMDHSVVDMKEYSFIMKMMYTFICFFISRGIKGKKDESNPEYVMMVSTATDCALRAMKINAQMNNGIFEGLLEMANGHFFKGIKTMLKK